IIAHRLSTIRDADQILVVPAGCCSEMAATAVRVATTESVVPAASAAPVGMAELAVTAVRLAPGPAAPAAMPRTAEPGATAAPAEGSAPAVRVALAGG
ncbi:hypothetical protein OSI15_12875, partial [Mycobacterium ulcerans]